MNRLAPFKIWQPRTVAEASEMLAEFGEGGRLYAGGTELLLAMRAGALSYDHLVDVKTVGGLAELAVEDGEVRIGAAVAHLPIERSRAVRERLPVLTYVESRVANARVRATGTLAGNLCFAEPHSDPATLLLCLGARVRVESRRGRRELGIGELIVGPFETSLGEDELVTQIIIPLPPENCRTAYRKFTVHEYPSLGLAVLLELGEGGGTIVGARGH
jgi:carbon-monoxide dehydrogenase medium subunit